MADSSFVRGRISIVKSERDKKNYRGLELKNGLRVTLVSHHTIKTSSVALDVACGSMMDPESFHGAAHFCERMLFYGSKEYPKENDFLEFLSSNAGSESSKTHDDHTLFQFSVQSGVLLEGLKRFAQFFIEPLFLESAMKREVRSIVNEHKYHMKDDSWRMHQVEKLLSSDRHEYGKCDTCNTKTIVEGAPRENLLRFFKSWYSANLMTLVIIGKEPMKTLKGFVELAGFHKIANYSTQKMTWPHPWGRERLGKRVQIVPVEDIRRLKLSFPVPYLPDESLSKPGVYVNYLIGYEGTQSLAAKLKRRCLATSVKGECGTAVRGFATYDFTVELTAKGLRKVDEVVKHFFNYVGMLNRAELPKRIQDELHKIGETHFEFMEKTEVTSSAEEMASTLQNFNFKDVITSHYLMPTFNPKLIRSILDSFNPKNMIYFVVSKTFAGRPENTVEPIYGTEMRVDRIPEDTIAVFNKALVTRAENAYRLPEKNDYIATVFARKLIDRGEHDRDCPHVLANEDWGRVWMKQNSDFCPQTMTCISIISPVFSQDARLSLLAYIFKECLNNSLAEVTYNAHLASLVSKVQFTQYGIEVMVSGYDEKQPLLIRNIMQRLFDFTINKERYKVVASLVRRKLTNSTKAQPYELGRENVSILLKEKFCSCEEMLGVFNGINRTHVLDFKRALFSDFYLEICAQGNISKRETLAMANVIRQTCNQVVTTTPRMKFRQRRLTPGTFVYRHYQNTHDVSCVNAVWQVGVQNSKDDAVLQLFVRLIQEAAVHELCTQKQIGDHVWVTARFEDAASGVEIVLQGPKEPEYVLQCIEEFLDSQRTVIENMTDDLFENRIKAVVAHLLSKRETLKQCSTLNWQEIASGCLEFYRESKQVEEVEKVKKEDVLEFFDSKIALRARDRRMLAVFVHGSKDYLGRKKRALADYLREIDHIQTLHDKLCFFDRPDPDFWRLAQLRHRRG